MSVTQKQVATDSMQELLGAAMLLGMKVAEQSYQGTLFDRQNQTVLNSISHLNSQLKTFLQLNQLAHIDENEVMPLFDEISRQQQSIGE